MKTEPATATAERPAPPPIAPRLRDDRGFRRHVMLFSVLVTVGFELLTLAVRFGSGMSAVEFNKTAPLIAQIHHMFWGAPLFAIAPLTRCRWPRVTGALVGTGIGFILSDLIHHFIVLPILVGNTGWHWP